MVITVAYLFSSLAIFSLSLTGLDSFITLVPPIARRPLVVEPVPPPPRHTTTRRQSPRRRPDFLYDRR
jgi:hypothetical protein